MKCQALLLVVDGRRVNDGFNFPGEPGFDHTLLPSPYLIDAYHYIGSKFIHKLYYLISFDSSCSRGSASFVSTVRSFSGLRCFT